MTPLLEKILKQCQSIQNTCVTIGIDGPTASGKTTLANNLAALLKKQKKTVWVYRVDWALENRETRVKDLQILNQSSNPFPLEAQLHMRMAIVEDFLKKVRAFNESDKSSEVIILDNLYSREANGTLTGHEKVTLKRDMVILVEGHYTLQSNLDKYLDYNILLLADFETLLQRKIDRVKEYRNPAETIDYFWRIDVPSFQHHLKAHGQTADLALDTSQNSLQELSEKEIETWMKLPGKLTRNPNQKTSVITTIFSQSNLVNPLLKQSCQAVLDTIDAWDNQVNLYLRTSMLQIPHDLTEQAKSLLDTLHAQFAGQSIRFELRYSDALYNVYRRKLPLSIGISIEINSTIQMAFTVDIFQTHYDIHIVWAGGHHGFRVHRVLGSIDTNSKEWSEISQTTWTTNSNTTIKVYTPTEFTLPSFLVGLNTNPVFIGREGENITVSQVIQNMLQDGGVWIHRFALFSEIRFFQFILDALGFHQCQIGNYVLTAKHNNKTLQTRFKAFIQEWASPLAYADYKLTAENQLDALLLRERSNMAEIVSASSHFKNRDGYIFSQFMVEKKETIQEALTELQRFLLSSNRLLRKRATQFILEYFPHLTVSPNECWDNETSTTPISLDALTRLGPSILAEVYLWLSIRNQSSAILGANIYDVRQESIDSLGHLQAAHTKHTAIVLQSSLNACGQPETFAGKTIQGYLQPENGVKTFIEACLKAARTFYFQKGKVPPLYSIGLDHVCAEHDKPSGRAKRFLDAAISTGSLTHAVLDGAALFDAKKQTPAELKKAYEKLSEYAANLISDISTSYLIDRELCAGELNYIEATGEALIPTGKELQLFTKQYQDCVAKKGHHALLARPMLFIGNVGTTHHGNDTKEPTPERAIEWKHILKKENFISAVLHGTTQTSRHILKRASAACHKINVAGDFLTTIYSVLPKNIAQKLDPKKAALKAQLVTIRHDMNMLKETEKNIISNAIKTHSEDIMSAIQSPELTPMDEQFFRYITYAYTPKTVAAIIDKIQSRISEFHAPVQTPPSSNSHEFAASMIEVPLNETQATTQLLWDNAIKVFHIDAGDGVFITRAFSGLEKAQHLRKQLPDAQLHAHLMVSNPHHTQNGLSVIDQYIQAGCHKIGIHPRSFSNKDELIPTLQDIRKKGAEPGIVIEVSDSINDNLLSIIKEAKLNWVIVMGVSIGYGGQIFQFSSLNTLKTLRDFSKVHNHPLLLEIDGGLTKNNLQLCVNAGADYFAGWSIIKANDTQGMIHNIQHIQAILKT